MTRDEARAVALAQKGTTEKPHFDRIGFRVRRNYATLSSDGGNINLLLTPEEQAHYVDLSTAVRPVPNKWGDQGWTTVDLQTVDDALATAMLRTAWRNGGGKE